MNDIRERFLEDVKDHVITIIKNDRPYRHIRLSRPKSGTYRYDLITWPGHLCYTGDMGTYVFSRVADMFEFFRDSQSGEIDINPDYWSEKCLSTSVFGNGVREFDKDEFVRLVEQVRDEFVDDRTLSKDDIKDLNVEIEYEILDHADDINTIEQAHILINDFVSDYGLELIDTFEWHFDKFTHHFLWCCYAIVWGIQRYDNANGGDT